MAKAHTGAGAAGWGPAPGLTARWRLRLYIAGATGRSLVAMENLRRLCAERLGGQCQVEVVDLLQAPERAGKDGIVAMPVLLRVGQSPAKRVVGDLSNVERVLSSLGLE